MRHAFGPHRRGKHDHFLHQFENQRGLLPRTRAADDLAIHPRLRPDDMGQGKAGDQRRLSVFAPNAQIGPRCALRVVVDFTDEPLLKLHQHQRLADMPPFWDAAIPGDEGDNPFAARHQFGRANNSSPPASASISRVISRRLPTSRASPLVARA